MKDNTIEVEVIINKLRAVREAVVARATMLLARYRKRVSKRKCRRCVFMRKSESGRIICTNLWGCPRDKDGE